MKFESMDEQLINIYNIRNLEFVNFWDLHGTENSKILVIPAIMITYDGGKTLNLCARDKYFDIYVKKVVEVYNDEKNNILEDSLTDPFRLRQRIRIDDRTKRILDSGVLEKINDIYSFYDGKDSYSNSLLFEIDELKLILPIIKFHIKKVFNMSDIVVSFDEEINGYRNFYSLAGKVNGIDKYFILSFNKVSDNRYEVSIQGLVDKGIPVNIDIDFLKDSICVSLGMGDNMISCSSLYLVSSDVVKEIHTIKKDGVPIGYENRDLKEVDNDISNITDIDSDTCFKWFKLPFGGIYGINNTINEVSDTEKVIDRHNMFVLPSDDSFFIREYFSKSYCRNRTVSVDAIDVTLDEVKKNISCICIDSVKGIYAMESTFLDVGQKNGYYVSQLAGNYYYHLVESSDGINGISRDGLIPVSKEKNILCGVDLFNKAKVYRLVKGE
ncbi:MAG: hypothetical protein ACI4XM_01695 [Candidatus Coprovivens sp.]